MTSETIKNLEQLLRPYLGAHKKIVNTKLTRLTAPGENYGSVMLAVELTTKTSEGNEEKVHTVAKLLPSTELYREIFNVQVTFKNELKFYDTIVPTLQAFQREQGVSDVIDCFAQLYGGRISLDSTSTKVDDDAVLVIENLKVSGFSNIDRFNGFDLDSAKVILRALANFHGVSLALKLTKPEQFETKIKPHLKDYQPRFFDTMKEVVVEIIREDEECRCLIPKITIWSEKPLSTPREPFATIGHCDLWTNNIMLRHNKILESKFVDFQVISYRSPAADLFFFLWSSLNKNILQTHLSYLIEYYYTCFIDTLKQYKCNSSLFSFENFMKEMQIEAEFEFGHAIQFLVMVVHGKKGSQPEDEKMDKEFFMKNATKAVKENVWYMVKECHQRGWLY